MGGARLTGLWMAAAGVAWLGVAQRVRRVGLCWVRVEATATAVMVSIAAAAPAGSIAIGKITAMRTVAVVAVAMLNAPRGWVAAVIWKLWAGVAALSLAG